MFCIIYEFHVLECNEIEFQKVWIELTQLIKTVCQGLGSRLHKDRKRENVWIAYAQWPNKDTWEQQSNNAQFLDVELKARMKELCHSIQIIYELDRIYDFLIHDKPKDLIEN